jgi:hypothetical protein
LGDLLWETRFEGLTLGDSLWEAHFGGIALVDLLGGNHFGELALGDLQWGTHSGGSQIPSVEHFCFCIKLGMFFSHQCISPLGPPGPLGNSLWGTRFGGLTLEASLWGSRCGGLTLL